jgi:hypothetical protein
LDLDAWNFLSHVGLRNVPTFLPRSMKRGFNTLQFLLAVAAAAAAAAAAAV